MKPHTWIPIVATACFSATGYAVFDHNSQLGVASDLQLLSDATKTEKRENLEKDRLHFLDAIAKEAMVGKVPDVLFDDRGILQRSDMPKIIKIDQYFRPGETISEGLVISSVGVRNAKTKEWAAIAYSGGRLQIVSVYTPQEIKNTINLIRQKEPKS